MHKDMKKVTVLMWVSLESSKIHARSLSQAGCWYRTTQHPTGDLKVKEMGITKFLCINLHYRKLTFSPIINVCM